MALILATLVLACGNPDADHYAAVLDELPVPATWDLVHTTVRAPGGDIDCSEFFATNCPSVTRYYLVDGQPAEAYPEARDLAPAAGFDIDEEFDPECDAPPSGAACVLTASRSGDDLQIALFNPGDDPEGLGISQPDRSLIRITAERTR